MFIQTWQFHLIISIILQKFLFVCIKGSWKVIPPRLLSHFQYNTVDFHGVVRQGKYTCIGNTVLQGSEGATVSLGNIPAVFRMGFALLCLSLSLSVLFRAFPKGTTGRSVSIQHRIVLYKTAAHQLLVYGKSFSLRDKREKECQTRTIINRMVFKMLCVLCLGTEIFFNCPNRI